VRSSLSKPSGDAFFPELTSQLFPWPSSSGPSNIVSNYIIRLSRSPTRNPSLFPPFSFVGFLSLDSGCWPVSPRLSPPFSPNPEFFCPSSSFLKSPFMRACRFFFLLGCRSACSCLFGVFVFFVDFCLHRRLKFCQASFSPLHFPRSTFQPFGLGFWVSSPQLEFFITFLPTIFDSAFFCFWFSKGKKKFYILPPRFFVHQHLLPPPFFPTPFHLHPLQVLSVLLPGFPNGAAYPACFLPPHRGSQSFFPRDSPRSSPPSLCAKKDARICNPFGFPSLEEFDFFSCRHFCKSPSD